MQDATEGGHGGGPSSPSCPEDLRSAESVALFRRYRLGHERAVRDELIERHAWVARTGARGFADRGEPLDDLEQVGLLGVLRAVERFDPDNGTPFTAYALITVRGEIRRHFRDATWSIHVPRPAKDLEQRLAPTVEALTHELCRPARPAEVAAALGVSVDHVLEAMQVRSAYRAASITAVRAAGGAPDPSVEGHADGATDRVALDDVLGALSARDRRIVELRFYDQLSQAEIARRVGISQVQVSRLLRRILLELRDRLGDDVVPTTEPMATAS